MLGLLTFILAFTFWLAATHFDAARQAFLNEANAIRTAYLRADLLPEPQRTEIRNLLREYVDVRLEGARSGKIEQAIAQSEELHARLWSQAIAARDKTSSPIFTGYFIQSLNDVIALHARRLTVGREFRIPNTIWIVLFVVLPLALGVRWLSWRIDRNEQATGGCGVRSDHFHGYDIDKRILTTPRKGTLRVSQQALADCPGGR